MSKLAMDVRERGGYAVVGVTGDVDYFTCEQFRRSLDTASDVHPRLVLDLTEMTFMDSAGLGELVRVWKKVSPAGGRVAVVCTNRIVLRLLGITGVDRVLDVFDSVEEAIPVS